MKFSWFALSALLLVEAAHLPKEERTDFVVTTLYGVSNGSRPPTFERFEEIKIKFSEKFGNQIDVAHKGEVIHLLPRHGILLEIKKYLVEIRELLEKMPQTDGTSGVDAYGQDVMVTFGEYEKNGEPLFEWANKINCEGLEIAHLTHDLIRKSFLEENPSRAPQPKPEVKEEVKPEESSSSTNTEDETYEEILQRRAIYYEKMQQDRKKLPPIPDYTKPIKRLAESTGDKNHLDDPIDRQRAPMQIEAAKPKPPPMPNSMIINEIYKSLVTQKYLSEDGFFEPELRQKFNHVVLLIERLCLLANDKSTKKTVDVTTDYPFSKSYGKLFLNFETQ